MLLNMNRFSNREDREKSPGLQTFGLPPSETVPKSSFIVTPGGNSIPITGARWKGSSHQPSSGSYHSGVDSHAQQLNPAMYGQASSLTSANSGFLGDRYIGENIYSSSLPIGGARFGDMAGGAASGVLNAGAPYAYRRAGGAAQPQPIWQSSTSNSSSSMNAIPGSYGSYRTASSYDGSEFGPLSSEAQRQLEILNDKRRRRRESHNAVERRRRDNINERIVDLDGMIPADNIDPAQRANKGQVLRRAVHYIRQLQTHIRNSAERAILLETALKKVMQRHDLSLGDVDLPADIFDENTANLTEKALHHFLVPIPQSAASQFVGLSSQPTGLKGSSSARSLPRSLSQSSASSMQPVSDFPAINVPQSVPIVPGQPEAILSATEAKNSQMVLQALLGFANLNAQSSRYVPQPLHSISDKPSSPIKAAPGSSNWPSKELENQHFLDSMLNSQLFGVDSNHPSLHEDLIRLDNNSSIPASGTSQESQAVGDETSDDEFDDEEDDKGFRSHARSYDPAHASAHRNSTKPLLLSASQSPMPPPFVTDLSSNPVDIPSTLHIEKNGDKGSGEPAGNVASSNSTAESNGGLDFRDKHGRYLGDSMLLD